MIKNNYSCLEKRALHNIEIQKIPGCVCLVATPGNIMYHEAFGFEDYTAKKPMARNSMFRLASMTKPVTGVTTMTLVEKGLLSLDDKVSKFLPGFSEMYIGKMENGKAVPYKEAEKEITIKHLLSHCSGLGSGEVGNAQMGLITTNGTCVADIGPRYQNILLDFEPESTNAYSGHMALDLLTYLCEFVSGMPFNELVDKNVLSKAETNEVTFLPTDEQDSRLVKMHRETPDGLKITEGMDGKNFAGVPRSYFAGSCSMLGTAEGYYKFASILATGGRALSGERVLKEETVKLMRTPAFGGNVVNCGFGQYWGLSMRVIKEPQGPTAVMPVDSFGWSGAYGTHFFINPADGLTAIYMMNCSTANGAGAITAREFEIDVLGE